MSEHFEVTRASDDQESQDIREGIALATDHEGPWEFGHYVETLVLGVWVPSISPFSSLADAEWPHATAQGLPREKYRNSRIVRRTVSPWEVVS